MPSGRLAYNVVAFVRILRRAGVPVGPTEALRAVEAVGQVGVRRRDDVYWALRSSLVRRAGDALLFDEAFQVLWGGLALAPEGVSPVFGSAPRPAPLRRRVAEALDGLDRRAPRSERRDTTTALSASRAERLGTVDFADMSVEEAREARDVVRRMVRPLPLLPQRRFRTRTAGDAGIDLRSTLRLAVRNGGIVFRLVRKHRRERPLSVVVLCDISGSMAPYTRMLLHFMHALAAERRCFAFVFGTRLTNVTRALRRSDPDVAVRAAVAEVPDWSGGTRIGAAVRAFNRNWSRRVLAQRAVVLLVTDGLERDASEDLAGETARLRRSCDRLIWLNPLLRFEGFEPRAAGMASIAPHVDERRPVHTLDSLGALAEALASASGTGRRPQGTGR